MNVRDRYHDGSIHIFDDDTKSPIGGSVSMFANLQRKKFKKFLLEKTASNCLRLNF